MGDKFCELVEQEKEAKSWAGDDGKSPMFKQTTDFMSCKARVEIKVSALFIKLS